MGQIEDADYLRRRIAEERARASTTELTEVRRVHAELAALYTARLRELEIERPILRVVA